MDRPGGIGAERGSLGMAWLGGEEIINRLFKKSENSNEPPLDGIVFLNTICEGSLE